MKLFYKPWRGAGYKRNPELLVLSESAYCWEGGCPRQNHPTEHTYKIWVLKQFDERHDNQARYIAWLTRALCGKESPTEVERKTAWSGIAYSIYVQVPIDNRFTRPTGEELRGSGEPFLELIKSCKPRKVFITSIASWNAMPDTDEVHPTDTRGRYGAYRLPDGNLVWCLAVPHQRARRMGWEQLGERIEAFQKEKLPSH